MAKKLVGLSACQPILFKNKKTITSELSLLRHILEIIMPKSVYAYLSLNDHPEMRRLRSKPFGDLFSPLCVHCSVCNHPTVDSSIGSMMYINAPQ